jgi:hypothetical protein
VPAIDSSSPTPTPDPPTRNGSAVARRWRWAALLLATGAAFWMVWAPAWALRPFVPQTPALLARAYIVRRAAPAASLLALVLAVALAWSLWRAARRWGRLALVAAVLVAGAASWLARQNHFEWMFNPLPHPSFASAAAAASFVAARELVLAIEIRGDAAAFPVRQIAYHHVVLDTVGGTPVAVTY